MSIIKVNAPFELILKWNGSGVVFNADSGKYQLGGALDRSYVRYADFIFDDDTGEVLAVVPDKQKRINDAGAFPLSDVMDEVAAANLKTLETTQAKVKQLEAERDALRAAGRPS